MLKYTKQSVALYNGQKWFNGIKDTLLHILCKFNLNLILTDTLYSIFEVAVLCYCRKNNKIAVHDPLHPPLTIKLQNFISFIDLFRVTSLSLYNVTAVKVFPLPQAVTHEYLITRFLKIRR